MNKYFDQLGEKPGINYHIIEIIIFGDTVKAKSSISKILMQMAVIKRSITAGLHFSTVVFDSWYFSSRLVRFLEREKKDWVTEAKSNRTILVNGSWMTAHIS